MSKFLSPEQTAEGIKKCMENVESLFKDAVFLFQNKRYSRATSLAISCLEEVGKMEKLREMLQIDKNDHKRLNKFWKEFRSHEIKSTTALISSNVGKMRKANIDSVDLLAAHFESSGPEREHFRQKGLYVDFNEEENKWHSPGNISSQQATEALKAAEKAYHFVKTDDLLGKHSLEVLKIQKKHFKPLWDLHLQRKENSSNPPFNKNFEKILLKCQVDYYKELLDKKLLNESYSLYVYGLPVREFIKKFDTEGQND